MKARDKLWVEILRRDRKLSKLSDKQARLELAEGEFPKALVEAFLSARAALSSSRRPQEGE
jgi:hypothetical protein